LNAIIPQRNEPAIKAVSVMSVQDLRIEFPTRDRSQTVKAVDGVDVSRERPLALSANPDRARPRSAGHSFRW
jgi:hypothetical protein